MNPVSRLLKLVPPSPLSHPSMQDRRRSHAGLGLAERPPFSAELDDVLVNTAVKSAIQCDPALSRAGIHVSTSRGVVQLSGFVAGRGAIGRAVAVARSISGVRSVRNDMLRG